MVNSTGIGVPALTSRGYLAQYYSENITTTTAGHWLVSKTAGGIGQICAPTYYGAFYYVEVDGAPVRSSLSFKQNAASTNAYDLDLRGVTDAVIPAGTHTVTIDSVCATNSSSKGFNRGTCSTSASVVVLG